MSETKRLIAYVSEDVYEAVGVMASLEGRKVSNYVAQMLKKEAINGGFIDMASEGSRSPQEKTSKIIDKVSTPPLKTLSGASEASEDTSKTAVAEGVDDWC